MSEQTNGESKPVVTSQLLPKLPDIPVPVTDFRGPTPWSNFVIQGRVLVGAYPATINDSETRDILLKLLKLGINTFVCLQAEFNLGVSEFSWRSGKTLRPYIKDAQKLLMEAKRARQSDSNEFNDLLDIKQSKLDLLHLPIVDGSVTSDSAISNLADDCCQRILNGERLYIHCWGGHGRSGTLVAIILSRLYGLSGLDSLHYTQQMHDVRISSQNTGSPQTQAQIIQVLRIISQTDPLEYQKTFKWPFNALLPFTANEEERWKYKMRMASLKEEESTATDACSKIEGDKRPRAINIIADAMNSIAAETR